MPIFFQHEIDESTRLAVWRIEEAENFFNVPLHRDITHPHKRRQHLAGRYLLRFLYPDFPLELIKIADTRKPYLDDEAFHFSISHCSNYAAAIVSKNKRVGVDIEVPTVKVDRIKQKFLHTEELKMLDATLGSAEQENKLAESPDCLLSTLTLLWSAKEAVFKWWSFGSVDFSEMIRLDTMPLEDNGTIKARFRSAGNETALQLHYRLFNNICLSWVTG